MQNISRYKLGLSPQINNCAGIVVGGSEFFRKYFGYLTSVRRLPEPYVDTPCVGVDFAHLSNLVISL
jgi:hypothetical protein